MTNSPTASFIVYSAASSDLCCSPSHGGLGAGTFVGSLCMVVACVYGAKHGYVMKRDKMTAAIILKTIWEAIPNLFSLSSSLEHPFRLFHTHRASGVAVVYAFLCRYLFIKYSIKDIPKILVDTAVMTTIVMLIIGASSVLSFVCPSQDCRKPSATLLLKESPITGLSCCFNHQYNC